MPEFNLRVLAGLVLASVGVILSGCDSSSGTKRMILLTNSDAPFWSSMWAGMSDAAVDLKLSEAGLKVEMDRVEGGAKGQLDKLNQYAGQGDIAAVALSLTESGSASLADAMRRLRRQGIEVITVDCDIDRETARDARFAYLGTDNVVGGRELGRAAKALRPQGGKFAAFVGEKSAGNAQGRMQGFVEGAGEQFELIDYLADDGSLERAHINVRNALINHPEVDTLVGIWAYNADAIGTVVEERGIRNRITTVVFDADPRAIEFMAKGLIDVMVVQNPYDMGYKATKLMDGLVHDDQKTVSELFPDWDAKSKQFTKADGDLITTGLKVVVPNEKSPLRADLFEESTQFLTLPEFRSWLDKYKLKGS